MNPFEKGQFYNTPDDEFSNFVVALPSALGLGTVLKKKKQKEKAKKEAQESLKLIQTTEPTKTNANVEAQTTLEDISVEKSSGSLPKTPSGVDTAPLTTDDLTMKPKPNYKLILIGVGALVVLGYFLTRKK